MILKTTLLFEEIFDLRTLVRMTLHGILSESALSADDLARRLRCKADEVGRFLSHSPVPERDGPEAFSMGLGDLEGKSPVRARFAIENAIVRALVMSLDAEKCNRLIARMLHVEEYTIRRIRARAGIASARSMRAARLGALRVSQAVPKGPSSPAEQEPDEFAKPAMPILPPPHSASV